jgi:hypothetical protein
MNASNSRTTAGILARDRQSAGRILDNILARSAHRGFTGDADLGTSAASLWPTGNLG